MILIARLPLRLLTFLVAPLCALALLAGAAPTASAIASRATASTAGKIASSYFMNFDNITYSTTSTGSLTDMSVGKSGDVSGEMTVNPPLYGTGALTGTLKGDTIKFSALDGDYKGTVDLSTQQISGTYTYPGQNGEWTATPASKCEVDGTCKPTKCPNAYEQPTSWDTQRVDSDVPGIDDYIEPLNVIISACSTVSLSEIETALGNWSTVHSTWQDVDGLHFKCISSENADVAGHGYVAETVAWRLTDVRGVTGRRLSALRTTCESGISRPRRAARPERGLSPPATKRHAWASTSSYSRSRARISTSRRP